MSILASHMAGRSLRMVRDPDAQSLVDYVRSAGEPALWERGVEGARAYLEERAATAPLGPPVELVEDQTVPAEGRSIAVRIYRPSLSAGLPVVVYLHGGGWVVGSVRASDSFCRRVAQAASCVVVSVDYRLAPDHPFPAGIQDAVTAITWTAEHAAAWGGDPRRLVVLGDSAGGNIATVAVRRLVAEGKPLVVRQILAYPSTTADRGRPTGEYGSEWPLTDADRVWFLDQYVTSEQMRRDADVAPLHADASGMPPTTLLLAGCDPLLHEGLAYAEHLCSAGVSVDLHLYAGQIHGFLTLDEAVLRRSREALGVVANAVRNA